MVQIVAYFHDPRVPSRNFLASLPGETLHAEVQSPFRVGTMAPRLDELDRLIVHELRCNARMTFAELSAHVGLSESQCVRRLHALEQSGVIQGYLTLIDPTALRLPVTAHIEIRLH